MRIGAGAGLGALARFGLSSLFAFSGGLIVLLVINILGSAVMGFARPGPFWGKGVLGGFTSFATFAFVTGQLGPLAAAGYVLATAVGCIGAYLLGGALR